MSSTWIRSSLVKNWIGDFFPPEVGGGIPGSLGPEVLSSIVDHDLQLKKHGASLDFRHAFDSVDLCMMKDSLSKSLPFEMKGWINLLFLQWCSMQRWILYDGTAFHRPIVVQCGLPQGDPAAPLITNILIHNCCGFFDRELLLWLNEKMKRDFYVKDMHEASTLSCSSLYTR